MACSPHFRLISTFVAEHSTVAGPVERQKQKKENVWVQRANTFRQHWNSLAIAFPRSSTIAVLAARVRVADIAIFWLPTDFAATFARLLTISMRLAAVFGTDSWRINNWIGKISSPERLKECIAIDFACLRMWHRIPVHPGWHLHSSGLVQEPCWQPGKTWHSLHVGPAQPRRQRHSPGISQYPRVWWQSSRQIAVNWRKHFLFSSVNSYDKTYVPNRIVRPSPYCKYIRMIHCTCNQTR